MENVVFTLLCAIVGGTLANLNVNVSDLRFWIILGCVGGANICGYISGMKKNI